MGVLRSSMVEGKWKTKPNHMRVLGSDLKLRSGSIGDYSTLMKIP